MTRTLFFCVVATAFSILLAGIAAHVLSHVVHTIARIGGGL